MLIDTHTHIFSHQFDNDRDAMLQRATQAGVAKFLMPNIDSQTIDAMMMLARQYPESCIPMMGLHPTHVKQNFEDELNIVEAWLQKEKFCAIGETGIDLYWDKTLLDLQIQSFRAQIRWAKQYQIPIVIHARESLHVIFDVLEQEIDSSLTGVFHCFSGTLADAQRAVDFGFMLGIGGVVTFKNGGLDKVLPHIDLQHLVLETDSPYLAPAPHRSKRNEPAYITLVAQRVAELYNLSVPQVVQATTDNAKRLFKL